jgi:hypothetical protein
MMMMMILLIFAHIDERGHFYVMGCQLIRRRRQLGPIGRYINYICAVILRYASLFFLAFRMCVN